MFSLSFVVKKVLPALGLLENMDISITTTERGRTKLSADGYLYVKKKEKGNKIRWVCQHSRTTACKGALTTNLLFGDPTSIVAHNHAAQASTSEVHNIRRRMQQLAHNVTAKPSQVIAQCLQDASEEARTHIGQLESCKRDIRRQRRKLLPAEPASMNDVIVPDEWRTTSETSDRRFLLHADEEGNERILIFATDQQLRTLATSRTWHMDGTFATCPSLFAQLYTIRVPLDSTSVTCVYALLPGKSQAVYERFLRIVVAKCEERDIAPLPSRIITDFEHAVLQAISTVFGPNVHRQGCFYHLCQATWRKIQNLGLTTLYRADENIRDFVGMVDGLALLPLQKLDEGMQFLRREVPTQLEEFLDYFDATYVSGTMHRLPQQDGHNQGMLMRLARRPPTFLPETWNVHDATLNGDDRTNNACEGWNNSFRILVGAHHPSFYRLLDALRKDVAMSETMLLQHRNGDQINRPQKRLYKQHQRRLLTFCVRISRDQTTVGDFLRSVGHTLRF